MQDYVRSREVRHCGGAALVSAAIVSAWGRATARRFSAWRVRAALAASRLQRAHTAIRACARARQSAVTKQAWRRWRASDAVVRAAVAAVDEAARMATQTASPRKGVFPITGREADEARRQAAERRYVSHYLAKVDEIDSQLAGTGAGARFLEQSGVSPGMRRRKRPEV